MNNTEVLVKVENVSKKFCRKLKRSLWYGMKDLTSELLGGGNSHTELREDEFWALKDVSFELRRGESLGLIGLNGAGKSTLLKLLNGLIKPDKGRITMRGRVGALIELGTGFNPILTGRENIYNNAAVLGISKRQVDRIIHDIIDFAGLDEFMDTPVQSYSSGMRVRLGFGVAAHLHPDVLLIDEVLSVGDMHFRRKCLNRMRQIRETGTAVVFVSHYMQHVDGFCNRAIFLSAGKVQVNGSTSEAIAAYQLSNSLNSDKSSGAFAGPSAFHTGEIEIYDVEFFGQDGKTKTLFQSGEPFFVRVKYHAPRRLDNPVFGFAIQRSDGLYCVLEKTYYHHITIPYIEGDSEFVIEINPLQLNSGYYRTQIIIWDSEIVLPYVDRMEDNFVVQSYMPPIDIIDTGYAVFHPKIRWHVPEIQPAPPRNEYQSSDAKD